MDMVPTGRMMGAEEAERSGLVARVVPADALQDEALKMAQAIAGYGKLAVMSAKEAVEYGLVGKIVTSHKEIL